MDISKTPVWLASLIALIILATGFNALGAQYSVGAGNDDWWTGYPDQSSGGEVNHPAWVLDALKSKPVLIYVHKQCDYCVPQTEAVKKMAEELDGKIAFYEIDADSGDVRAEEALRAYDPNGGTMYVPLTAIVTLASDSEGKVVPVWHSTDQVTGEEWIKNYVEDALSQYDENSANWDQ